MSTTTTTKPRTARGRRPNLGDDRQKPVFLTLSDESEALVTRIARATGCSRQEVIRRVLDQFLGLD